MLGHERHSKPEKKFKRETTAKQIACKKQTGLREINQDNSPPKKQFLVRKKCQPITQAQK